MSKVALVTGASRGIGLSIARQLILADYNVGFVSRNPSSVVTDLQHPRAFSLPCNVRDSASISEAVQSTMNRFGRVDTLINCAGVSHDSLLVRQTDKELDEMFEANLFGAIKMSREVVKLAMLPQSSGVIINIGSVVGSCGSAGQSAYASTKSGLIGFTKSLAKELASRHILVNLVEPGFVETDITKRLSPARRQEILAHIPLKRFGNPTEIADMVMFLVQAKYVTGQTFRVDGGLFM